MILLQILFIWFLFLKVNIQICIAWKTHNRCDLKFSFPVKVLAAFKETRTLWVALAAATGRCSLECRIAHVWASERTEKRVPLLAHRIILIFQLLLSNPLSYSLRSLRHSLSTEIPHSADNASYLCERRKKCCVRGKTFSTGGKTSGEGRDEVLTFQRARKFKMPVTSQSNAAAADALNGQKWVLRAPWRRRPFHKSLAFTSQQERSQTT